MRLYIIGNVCSISASATAIQPTNMPTHNPYIAIIIFPQILLTVLWAYLQSPDYMPYQALMIYYLPPHHIS